MMLMEVFEASVECIDSPVCNMSVVSKFCEHDYQLKHFRVLKMLSAVTVMWSKQCDSTCEVKHCLFIGYMTTMVHYQGQ